MPQHLDLYIQITVIRNLCNLFFHYVGLDYHYVLFYAYAIIMSCISVNQFFIFSTICFSGLSTLLSSFVNDVLYKVSRLLTNYLKNSYCTLIKENFQRPHVQVWIMELLGGVGLWKFTTVHFKLTWAQNAQGELLWPAFVRRPLSASSVNFFT